VTPNAPGRLLLADDDPIYRVRLAKAFERRGFTVHEAHDGRSALEVIASYRLDYAIVDLRMPAPSGLELVQTLAKQTPLTITIVLTGYGSIATALEAIRLGATDYLQKPADVQDLLHALARRRPTEGSEPSEVVHTPTLARAEWEHVQRVLADCGGNISEAARVLGIARRTLQRKLAKYPVPR